MYYLKKNFEVENLVVCFHKKKYFQRRIFGNVKFDEHHGTISIYDGIGKTLIGKKNMPLKNRPGSQYIRSIFTPINFALSICNFTKFLLQPKNK